MSASTPKILVVDDEPKIRQILASYLRQDGFDVMEAADGETALEMIGTGPDVVILDIQLPGLDGIEVLRQFRISSDVPVILLTARAEEADRLIGLSVGADDYVTKPFSAREVVLRVKAVLRRTSRSATPSPEVVLLDGLSFDSGTRSVTINGADKLLTALEFDLLGALIDAGGRVLSRRQLIQQVWGWDFYGDERVVDVHIRNLRGKLGDDAGDPRYIATVRGVGYRFLAPRQ